ncbi:MAG: DUF438 domain-containing protein [Parachlamydiales bacterium]|nr:DUF438 domain-containing protein [Parachlamydiales bacterium]
MKTTTRTLDLRNMPPFERHVKIFEMWDSLKEEETLRIINDHEPRPLYYQFEAEHNGQFEWNYEEEGPKDWIFLIKKISSSGDKRKKIKELIRKLHSKENIKKHKDEAKKFLKNISPTDLGIMEQEIIKEGVTRKEMRKLCDVHLDIMKENLEKKDLKLKPGHPIHTLMAEHDEILAFIEKLKIINNKVQLSESFEELGKEMIMLNFIAKHLVEADKHHQREEDVLFLAMERKGITEPPQIMREEHVDLKKKKKELYKLSENYKKMDFAKFVKKMKSVSEFIIETLPDHIYKENYILYPMAVEVIRNDEEWEKIKNDCDRIGYCCFTPKS